MSVRFCAMRASASGAEWEDADVIYLDNAATSFPKPPRVQEEQNRCMRLYCGNPGRGSHRLAMQAAEKIFECRGELASLFGSRHPENVVFTMNATMALNTAIKGLLQQGDHVLISDLEHNAVWRPVCRLAREGRITYDVFPSYALFPDRTPEQICRGIEARVRPNTRMLVCTHASNICPVTMPLREIGELCRRLGLLFVVDASQSAAHIPGDMEEMRIDALCAPGHKGLFGVQGSGFVLLGEDLYADTLLEGGSGVNSLDEAMPDEAPERYEAGTLPTPAIAGLCEGVRAIKEIGLDAIAEREHMLCGQLLERLSSLRGIQISVPHARGPVVLFHSPRLPADRIGAELDRRGICVRTGFHCAALAHRTLRSPADGAVRVSPGYYNTKADIDALWRALREILE